MGDDLSYDIAIVGAGIIGCAMALNISKQLPRLRIVLLDKSTPKAYDAGSEIDSRVYAINAASQQLLNELGIWGLLDESRYCAYQTMSVWEDEHENALSFYAGDVGHEHLGFIIEHQLLHHRLYQQVQAQSNISLELTSSLSHIEQQPTHVSLHTEGGQHHVRLLIAADGGQSSVRKLAGINAAQTSYLQSAIVANVKTSQPHQHTAWQRFLPTGTLAFLPLSNGQSSIVWSLPEHLIASYQAMDEDEFLAELSEQSQFALGQIEGVTERRLFPLQHKLADQYVKSRIALIGDAAHVVHPLAGQGLNLGLHDVSVLTKVLTDAQKQQIDFGQLHILKRYQRQCRPQQHLMSESLGGLNKLFMQSQPWLSSLRPQALSGVNRSHILKRFFIQQAIGRV